MKKLLWILLALLLASVVVNLFLMTRQPEVTEHRDTDFVERWDTIRDTLPAEKGKKIVKYIRIPCPQQDTAGGAWQQPDTMPAVALPVIQKTYSDDSTYTAYVSGLQIDSFPRLDSIRVRQKTIERTITVTQTEKKKARRLRFGVYAGYGYGFRYKGFEPQVGVGISYTW